MNIKKLIQDLKNLRVNESSFKANESAILSKLKILYEENSKLFSIEDVKEIKNMIDIKNLSEDITYCKSKESIHDLISDLHFVSSEVGFDGKIYERIQTYIRICLENKNSLPSDVKDGVYSKFLVNERKLKESFGIPPKCPKCKKLMTLRNSSYGYFWGCIYFPSCWGKKKARKIKVN